MAARRAVDVRREEILRAAVDQIAERGFANTRVVDVAKALNVSTALVFYHFESKDRLLSEAFNYAAEQDLARLARIRASRAGAAGRLSRVLALYGPSRTPTPAWRLWIEAWAAALRVPELQAVSRRLDVQWKTTVAEIIAEGVATSEFCCPDPDGAAWRIIALIDGLAISSTVHAGLIGTSTRARWIRGVVAAEVGIPADRLAEPARRRS
ncbi:MAG TPA: TetR family transcriptional regulator C-terminal domain-containing protein [Mycobacteriales bacterium]|nr:TetR family transcriptional regulator C-terminal domain-containing protein [Mycobacteriales bacterium]